MSRTPNHATVTISTTAANCTAIDLGVYAAGSFCLPATSDIVQINVYAKIGSGDWAQATDELNGDIQLPVTAGKPRALPDTVYKFHQIKLVAAAGTEISSVPVFLKD